MAVAIAGRARDRDQRQHGTAHDAQWKQPLAWAEARAHRRRYGEGEEEIPRQCSADPDRAAAFAGQRCAGEIAHQVRHDPRDKLKRRDVGRLDEHHVAGRHDANRLVGERHAHQVGPVEFLDHAAE